MQTDQMSDDDWNDILQELRSEVVYYGFGEWDSSMQSWWQDLPEVLDEDGGAAELRVDPRQRLKDYVAAFSVHLGVLTPASMVQASERLGKLLTDREGRPVTSAAVATLQGNEVELNGRNGHVAMIEFLDRFLREIDGEDTGLFEEDLR